jgi:hypothetical protein
MGNVEKVIVLFIRGPRDVAIGGVCGGCNTPPPIIQTLVKVGQNGTDIFPKLVKKELIFA